MDKKIRSISISEIIDEKLITDSKSRGLTISAGLYGVEVENKYSVIARTSCSVLFISSGALLFPFLKKWGIHVLWRNDLGSIIHLYVQSLFVFDANL